MGDDATCCDREGILKCYPSTGAGCQDPGADFVGWHGSGNSQTVQTQFMTLVQIEFELEGGGHWDWDNQCKQGSATKDDFVLDPEYKSTMNGCQSNHDSWITCGNANLLNVVTKLNDFLPGATFGIQGRSRHHQWIILNDCTQWIAALNEKLNLFI